MKELDRDSRRHEFDKRVLLMRNFFVEVSNDPASGSTKRWRSRRDQQCSASNGRHAASSAHREQPASGTQSVLFAHSIPHIDRICVHVAADELQDMGKSGGRDMSSPMSEGDELGGAHLPCGELEKSLESGVSAVNGC